MHLRLVLKPVFKLAIIRLHPLGPIGLVAPQKANKSPTRQTVLGETKKQPGICRHVIIDYTYRSDFVAHG